MVPPVPPLVRTTLCIGAVRFVLGLFPLLLLLFSIRSAPSTAPVCPGCRPSAAPQLPPEVEMRERVARFFLLIVFCVFLFIAML